MKQITDVREMQESMLAFKRAGKTIAFVPTMGFLHEGHATLLRTARAAGDILVLSIFVNPTQFGPQEDLDSYPRNLAGDLAVAQSAGVDCVFTPTPQGMYPAGFQSTLSLDRLTRGLCGASRPGHFNGVAIVVTKLLMISGADVAFFGKKDYQQLAVIRQMVQDLNLPVSIEGVPIVRETDGLAMSSRNSYLSSEERQQACCLYRALSVARQQYAAGETTGERLLEKARSEICAVPGAVIDYLELCDATTLEPVSEATGNSLLAMAVKIGRTRLIDNTVLGEEL